MKKTSFATFLISLFFVHFLFSLFEQKFPSKITSKQVKRMQKNADTELNFVSDDAIFMFQYRQGKAGMACRLYKDPAIFLSPKQQKLFSKSVMCIDRKPVEVYTLHYGDFPVVESDSSKSRVKPNSNEYWKSYLFSEKRRVFEKKKNPQCMSFHELEHYLLNNKVAFYTGAGISISGGVWGMDALCKELGLEQFKQDPEIFVENLARKKEEVFEKFKNFCESMFFNPPTGAHYALKNIAERLQCPVLTENLDYLHEQTGIKPQKLFNVKKSKRLFSSKFLKKIDAIVCIGLSYDDRAFLAWYKENNPTGKIISIDIKQPSYLADEDFFVQGDLQNLLVSIDESLKIDII